MRLTLALVLCFLAFTNASRTCSINKYVPKDEPTNVSSNCFYIKLDEFSGYTRVKLKVTLKDGYFNEDIMYYGVYYYKPDSWNSYKLNVYENVDSKSYGTKIGNNYDYYTMYFTFPKLSFDYMFFYIPEYYAEMNNYVEIECTTSGISIGAIVGIVAAVVIIISVVVFIIYRKRKLSNTVIVPPTQVLYTPPPVQPAYPGGNY